MFFPGLIKISGGVNMAVKQIGISVGDIKSYQALSTDLEATYPTSEKCGEGSMMEVIDETTKTVTAYKVFNGTVWATI